MKEKDKMQEKSAVGEEKKLQDNYKQSMLQCRQIEHNEFNYEKKEFEQYP